MKKRKLLFGVLLASAAFSLAACTAKENKTTTKDPEKTSESTPVESTPVESATTTEDTTPEVVEKVLVSFYEVIESKDTELEDLAVEINKGSKLTLPAEEKLKKDGYKIVGYYTSKGCQTAFNFDKAIDDDCDVYIKYEKIGIYDTLAASKNKIIAYDFNDTVTIASGDKFEDATAPSIKGTTEGVKLVNKELSLDTAANAKSNVLFDFGKKYGSGIFQIYCEVNFTGLTKSGESFLQINGTTDGSSYARVFELRNDSSGLGWSFDGSNKNAMNPSVSIGSNTKFKFLITIDTSTGELIVANDSTTILTTTSNIIGINGIKFAQDMSKSSRTIDNVAVTFEEKTASPLVTAKNEALNILENYKNSSDYTSLGTTADNSSANAAKKKLIDTEIANTKKEISDATSIEEVNTAKTAWNTFVSANKYVITVIPYSEANTRADEKIESYYIADLAGKIVDLSKVSFTSSDVLGLYSDEALNTEFVNAALDSDKTVYAKIKTVVRTVIVFNDVTIDGSKDGATTTLAAGITYYAKNGSSLKDVESKNVTIEEIAIKKAINTGGKSDANKNYVMIDLKSVADTEYKKITITIAGGGSGTRNAYICDTLEGIADGVPASTAIKETISSGEQAIESGNAVVQGGKTYYITYDASIIIYGIVIEPATSK